MGYAEWREPEWGAIGRADLRRWWMDYGRVPFSIGAFIVVLLLAGVASLAKATDAIGDSAQLFLVVVILGGYLAAMAGMALQFLRQRKLEAVLRLSPDSVGFYVDVRVWRQGVLIGSDMGIAWFEGGQFWFRGRRTQFGFATRLVETVRSAKSPFRSGMRWVLADPIPRHELEVFVLDSISPYGVDSSVELFTKCFHVSVESDSSSGTMPPRVPVVRGTLLDFARLVHELGRPLRSIGYGMFMFGVLVFTFLYTGDWFGLKVSRSWNEFLMNIGALGIACWIGLLLLSYPLALLWLPVVRRRVSRAMALDPE